MVFKPQKTKYQLKVIGNLDILTNWAINPWRRYSLALTVLLIGWGGGSSLGMISAVVELMDPVGAFLSVLFIEILIQFRRRIGSQKNKRILVLLID